MINKFTVKPRQITDWMGNIRKTWCGPYALAVLTGTHYEFAYRTLKEIRRKRSTAGVTNKNMMSAFKNLNVKYKHTKLDKRKKLANYINDDLAPNKVYLVQITKHYLIIDTRDCTTIDNQVPQWNDMHSTKHSKKLVCEVFEILNPNFDPYHQNMDFRFDETNQEKEKLVAKS